MASLHLPLRHMAQCTAPIVPPLQRGKGGGASHQRGCCLYAENAFDSFLHVTFLQDWPPTAATPYPASRDFPLFRGQNGASLHLPLRHMAQCTAPIVPPLQRGKGGAVRHQRGCLLSAGNAFGAHSFSNSITLAVVILSTISQTTANLFSISSLVKRSTIYPFSFNFPLRHSS